MINLMVEHQSILSAHTYRTEPNQAEPNRTEPNDQATAACRVLRVACPTSIPLPWPQTRTLTDTDCYDANMKYDPIDDIPGQGRSEMTAAQCQARLTLTLTLVITLTLTSNARPGASPSPHVLTSRDGPMGVATSHPPKRSFGLLKQA